MQDVKSHRDLIVRQKAMELAEEAYRLARLMPKNEVYRLVSQLLRAAASVPANIAEGHGRGTRKDYANFVSIARGSLAETETFLLLAARATLIKADDEQRALALCTEIANMLNALLSRLRTPADADNDPKLQRLIPKT